MIAYERSSALRWLGRLVPATGLGARRFTSGSSPVVVPPFNQENQQPHAGDAAPQFHVCALSGRGCDSRVVAKLQLIAGLDVALGRIQQVHAKDRVVCAKPQMVRALFVSLSKNQLVCRRINRELLYLSVRQSYLGFLFGPA